MNPPESSVSVRHFLDISAHPSSALRDMIESAKRMKAAGKRSKALDGKILAMLFDKPSTRTRVSFDVAMRQLGGETIGLTGTETHLGRYESVADTARVLSRYVDAVVMRTTGHERLEDMAKFSEIPVINGLTDDTHPCQIMADVMTFEERLGPIEGKVLAWSGDGNNVLHSFIEASARFGFTMRVATPKGFEPAGEYVEWARANGAKIELGEDPKEAVSGADCVITDTWTSMNFEDEARNEEVFSPYRVDSELMSLASPDAIFLHCLPALRGQEVSEEVMDGPQSAVFDEAENRMHAQKAILAWCFGVESA